MPNAFNKRKVNGGFPKIPSPHLKRRKGAPSAVDSSTKVNGAAFLPNKEPDYVECPEPFVEEEDLRKVWKEYLAPSVEMLVFQTVHRPRPNYSYDSIMMVRHLCTYFNKKENHVGHYMESKIGLWRLSKHGKKLCGFDFELKMDKDVEQWIHHMRSMMQTINYRLRSRPNELESLVYTITGVENYVATSFTRLEILCLAEHIIQMVVAHAVKANLSDKIFKEQCAAFSNDVMIFRGKCKRSAVSFIRKICTCFDNIGGLSRVHDERVTACWETRETHGPRWFGNLVNIYTEGVANTPSEYTKMATNLSFFKGERYPKSTTFSRQAIRTRVLKDTPQMPQRESYVDARVQKLWWNFLCTRSYLLYIKEGDSKVPPPALRKEVKVQLDSGETMAPVAAKLIPSPFKRSELENDVSTEKKDLQSEDLDSDDEGSAASLIKKPERMTEVQNETRNPSLVSDVVIVHSKFYLIADGKAINDNGGMGEKVAQEGDEEEKTDNTGKDKRDDTLADAGAVKDHDDLEEKGKDDTLADAGAVKDDDGLEEKGKDDDKDDDDLEEKAKGHDDLEEKGKDDDDLEEKAKGHDDLEEKAKGHDDLEEKGKGEDDLEEKAKGHDDLEEKAKGHDDLEAKGHDDLEVKGKGHEEDADKEDAGKEKEKDDEEEPTERDVPEVRGVDGDRENGSIVETVVDSTINVTVRHRRKIAPLPSRRLGLRSGISKLVAKIASPLRSLSPEKKTDRKLDLSSGEKVLKSNLVSEEYSRNEKVGEGSLRRLDLSTEETVLVDKLHPQPLPEDIMESDDNDSVIVEKVVPPNPEDMVESDDEIIVKTEPGIAHLREEQDVDSEEETDGTHWGHIKEDDDDNNPYRLCDLSDIENYVFDYVFRAEDCIFYVENHYLHVWSVRSEHKHRRGFRIKSNSREFPRDSEGTHPETIYRKNVKQFRTWDESICGVRHMPEALVINYPCITEICILHNGRKWLRLKYQPILESMLSLKAIPLLSPNSTGSVMYRCLPLLQVFDEPVLTFQVAKVARFMWGCQKEMRQVVGRKYKEWEDGEESKALSQILGIESGEEMGFCTGFVELYEVEGIVELDLSMETSEMEKFEYTVKMGLPIARKEDGFVYQLVFSFSVGR